MGEQTQNRQWRRYSFAIAPDSDYELVFPDSSPNQGLVRNLSTGGSIYVGIDGYVSELKYEFMVEPNSSTIIGKAISFNRIYLHNPNSEIINVVVDSTYGEFDLSLLKEFKVNLSGEVAEEIRYDGIIHGFTSPLPAGTNNIGDVDVASLPSLPAGTNVVGKVDINVMKPLVAGTANIGSVDVDALPPLPAGTNNIGDVDVASLPPLPAGTNNIGDVDVASLPALPAGANIIGKVDINVMKPLVAGTANIGDVDVLTLPSLPAGTNNIGDVDVLTLPPTPSVDNYEYSDFSVAPSASSSIDKAFTEIIFITNDGTEPVEVCTKKMDDTWNIYIKLMAGETLQNVKLKGKAVQFHGVSTNVTTVTGRMVLLGGHYA